ncbi:carbohydrate ABC transporter membrane protein 1, CUT1 family [Salimicrobium halophilum]|uniref:Carbohydrate ABC transporter membrane protein 1, CUT1 family n=2 Tax=Salimicrobium halophilum TaxID=86666 RepID=A0A1G8SC45_9BACI|nr:carbohydrate ABC transporter membrane protein 1, CUT1 family [Salimicrobium halophilum]
MVAKQTRVRKKKNRIRKAMPYLLVGPLVIWILLTVFLPLSSVIRESFYSTGFVGTQGDFVGFENYMNVFGSAAYWGAWQKSLLWVVGNMVVQTILAFSVALLLNNNRKISQMARTWMIIPWVIPTIVVAIFWQWILNGSYGVLNDVLLSLNIIGEPLNLLGDSTWSLFVIIFINSWHWFPFLAVILLAGLSGIPKELYEASAMDGANKWQEFWKITLPSLQHTTFALGLVGTLWMFNIFDLIHSLTEGGPAGTTTTVPVLIYQEAFESYNLGNASAMSVVTALFLIMFAVLFVRFAAPKD